MSARGRAHRRLRLQPIGLILAVLGGLLAFTDASTRAEAAPATFTNPLNDSGGADPWMTYHDGDYYLMTTPWNGPITMRRSPTVEGLKTAEKVPVYDDFAPGRDRNVWAPEFHFLDGPDGPRWYIYYSAGPGDIEGQRVHVAESAGTDPMGPYTYKGMVLGAADRWGIDGSVVTVDGRRYLLWSGVPGRWTGNDPGIYIAELSSPWTVTGERTVISTPEHDWETQGTPMNEGPAAVQHDGRTFVTYSASACQGPDYKLGLLELTGTDPLSASSWTRTPDPVFQRDDAAGVYGPGHNGFFTSPDGTENWIVYHANSSASDGCGDTRTTRIQKFGWNPDGTPDIGQPAAPGVELAVPAQ